MEVFTKESWEKYKQYILEFNHNETKDLPINTMCGYLKTPTFEGYMNFVFSEKAE